MNIGFRNGEEDYASGSVPLEIVKEESYLSDIVCKDFKVGKQCFKATSMGNQVLWIIKRTFRSRSKNILIPLYKSLVRPQFDYYVQALGSIP